MSDTGSKTSKSFVKEAAILSLSGFAVKFIGLVYKIPLTTILDESMGVFTAAYSIYAMLFMISTSGLPVAISRMIAGSAEKGRLIETKKILKMSVFMFSVVGIVCSLLLFFGAETIAVWSVHPDSVLAMKVISPTLLFICIASAYRGYFQGLRNMNPTAISQFIEAFLKLIIGLGATLIARKMGYSLVVQAACAISGVTFGTFLGMLYLILYHKRKKNNCIVNKTRATMRYRQIAARMFAISLPVTITSSCLYLSNFLDTLVINKALIGSGIAEQTAEALYTSYVALTIPISDLLPSTLVYPIAISILPAVAGALALKKRKKAIGYIVSSIRISGIIALPSAFCLCALSRPAIALIYSSGWGKEIVLAGGKTVMPIDVASKALSILAIGIFFISLVSTTNALLQAVGRMYDPMKSVLAGVMILILLEVTLVSIKPIGIYGAPISSVACYVTALYMNMRYLRKCQNIKLPFRRLFLKPLVCSAICGVFCFISYKIGFALWQGNTDGRFASFVIL
ncbi:MAG: polysaccharide biosynthesis protein, partial [Eubacteriales bacterium]|nr:polysaccharide biosynthesis protein [Eubacteriales bacterium]